MVLQLTLVHLKTERHLPAAAEACFQSLLVNCLAVTTVSYLILCDCAAVYSKMPPAAVGLVDSV